MELPGISLQPFQENQIADPAAAGGLPGISLEPVTPQQETAIPREQVVDQPALQEDSWGEVAKKSITQGLLALPKVVSEGGQVIRKALDMPESEFRKEVKGFSEYLQPKTKSRAKKLVGQAITTVGEMASTGAVGGAKAILPLLSARAGTEKAATSLDEGYEMPTALKAGAGQAAIEYFTELIPLKILQKPGISFLKRLASGVVTDIPGELAATVGEMKLIDEKVLGKQYTPEQLKEALIDTAIVAGLVTGGATTGAQVLGAGRRPATTDQTTDFPDDVTEPEIEPDQMEAAPAAEQGLPGVALEPEPQPSSIPLVEAEFKPEERVYRDPIDVTKRYPERYRRVFPEPDISDEEAAQFEQEVTEELQAPIRERQEIEQQRQASEEYVRSRNRLTPETIRKRFAMQPAESMLDNLAARYNAIIAKKGKRSAEENNFVQRYESLLAEQRAVEEYQGPELPPAQGVEQELPAPPDQEALRQDIIERVQQRPLSQVEKDVDELMAFVEEERTATEARRKRQQELEDTFGVKRDEIPGPQSSEERRQQFRQDIIERVQQRPETDLEQRIADEQTELAEFVQDETLATELRRAELQQRQTDAQQAFTDYTPENVAAAERLTPAEKDKAKKNGLTSLVYAQLKAEAGREMQNTDIQEQISELRRKDRAGIWIPDTEPATRAQIVNLIGPGVIKKGGVGLDEVAQEFGYQNEDSFLEALKQYKSKQAQEESLIDEKIREYQEAQAAESEYEIQQGIERGEYYARDTVDNLIDGIDRFTDPTALENEVGRLMDSPVIGKKLTPYRQEILQAAARKKEELRGQQNREGLGAMAGPQDGGQVSAGGETPVLATARAAAETVAQGEVPGREAPAPVRAQKVTPRSLVESRTRAEINEQLDRIFGTEAELDALEEAQETDYDTGILAVANEFRADLERAAIDRNYEDAQSLLDQVRNDPDLPADKRATIGVRRPAPKKRGTGRTAASKNADIVPLSGATSGDLVGEGQYLVDRGTKEEVPALEALKREGDEIVKRGDEYFLLSWTKPGMEAAEQEPKYGTNKVRSVIDQYNQANNTNYRYDGPQLDQNGNVVFHYITDRNPVSLTGGSTMAIFDDVTVETLAEKIRKKSEEFNQKVIMDQAGRAFVLEDVLRSVYRAGQSLADFTVALRQKLGTAFDEVKDYVEQLFRKAIGMYNGNTGAPPPSKKQPGQFHEQNRQLRDEDKTTWNKARKKLKEQLAPGGLLPEPVFKDMLARDFEFNVIEFDTERLVAQLERAIRNDYGVKVDSLNEKQLNVISEGLSGNVSKTLKPQTKTAIVAMRQYIDGLSKQYIDILQQQADAMAADLDTGEQILFNAMRQAQKLDATIEKDMTSAEKGKITKQKNELMAKAKEAAKPEIGSDNKMVSAMANAAAAAEKSRMIDIIAGNVGKYVHRSYQAFDDPKWNRKITDEVANDARQYLTERYVEEGETAEEAARLAEVTMNEIVKTGTAYDNLTSFIKESKLGAKDLSVLQRRKEIAPEIRALLGEYKDPRVNFTKSSTKMGRLIFNHKFLDKVLQDGEGVFLFRDKNRPAQATAQIAAEGSEVLAPLNGMWTYPEIDQAFRDALGKENFGPFLDKVIQINGAIKANKTVYSPTTAMRNWQSAALFALINGHFDIRQMRRSASVISQYFSKANDKQKADYLREMIKLGVIYDSPYAAELSRLLADSRLENELLNKNPLGIKSTIDFAKKFYQYGDDFWKIIGFENEKNNLMKYAGMSEQEAKIEAAERIRNTYPTYSMVGKFPKMLSRFPLAGTFVSFPAEIVRTGGNVLRYTYNDFQDAKTRPLAMRRAAGIMLVAGFAAGLQALSKAYFGVDDDEEQGVRDLGAPWNRNSNLIFTGRDDKGNVTFIDISFLDAYNYFKRPLNAIMQDRPYQDIAKDVVRELLEPFFGTDIMAGTLFEIMANEKASGGRVYTENDYLSQQLVDIGNHLRKTVQPGVFSNVERMWKAVQGETSVSGKKYTLNDELLALGGWRTTTLDPKMATYYRSFEFKDNLNQADDRFRRLIKSNNERVDREEILQEYKKAAALRQSAIDKFGRLIDSARKSGMTDNQLKVVLKKGGMSMDTIRLLLSKDNRQENWMPSTRQMKNDIDRTKAMFGRETAIMVRNRYKQLMADIRRQKAGGD